MTADDLVQLASRIRDPRPDAEGPVVGFCCVSTPREILDAAGVLPYRIRALGRTERELADAHLSRFNCSFCRSCLQLGLDGTYDFLDGLIETNGCDHLRGMFENWQHERPAPFFHYLRVPHLVNEDTLAVYTEELSLLRDALATHYQVPLCDDSLRRAIAVQLRLGEKLERLQALRADHPPAITGAQALALMLLESALPPARFEELLDEILDAPRTTPRAATRRETRLLLAGSATDEMTLIQAIEDLGGLVVADGLCYGSRARWRKDMLDEGKDPLAALAEVYLENLRCPRMFADYTRRLERLQEEARAARVEGVILIHNKFCDLHGVENVRLRMDLEAQELPVLVLEKEYGVASDLGRIRTRVQAFLERLDRHDPASKKTGR